MACSPCIFVMALGFLILAGITAALPRQPFAAEGSGNACPSGSTMATQQECDMWSKIALSRLGKTAGRALQTGSWGHVPGGCSVESGGDWAAHYNTGSGTASTSYRLICKAGIPCHCLATVGGSSSELRCPVQMSTVMARTNTTTWEKSPSLE